MDKMREVLEYGHADYCVFKDSKGRTCHCGFSARCALLLMRPEYRAALALYRKRMGGSGGEYEKHDVCINGEHVEEARLVLQAALTHKEPEDMREAIEVVLHELSDSDFYSDNAMMVSDAIDRIISITRPQQPNGAEGAIDRIKKLEEMIESYTKTELCVELIFDIGKREYSFRSRYRNRFPLFGWRDYSTVLPVKQMIIPLADMERILIAMPGFLKTHKSFGIKKEDVK